MAARGTCMPSRYGARSDPTSEGLAGLPCALRMGQTPEGERSGRMSELTLVRLRVVQEVAARGSFTAAADALGYTQSAVSRQVASLEATAGTALFERGPRGVRVTEAGSALVRHAGTILDELSAAER